MILHLVLLSLNLPAGGIGVAPFRTDRHQLRLNGPLAQPASQKRLGPPVGASGIKIANAGSPGGVQDVMGVGFHRRHVILAGQVGGMTQIDIARPPQGAQAKT